MWADVQSDETFIVDNTAYRFVCGSITVVMPVCTYRLVVCQELSPVKLNSAIQGRSTVQVSNGHEGSCLHLAKRQLHGGLVAVGYVI